MSKVEQGEQAQEEVVDAVQAVDEPLSSQNQSQNFQQFKEILSTFPDPESKLQMTIDFMEASLAQSGTPHFRNFWEARKISLELFKENIPSALRSVLWEKYRELSREARRLKEILDEQCAFAVEQIEKAILAIETDISIVEETRKSAPPLEYPIPSNTIQKDEAFYQGVQQELGILNGLASKINSLRKELVKTEMRVKQKNKFFKQLSSVGDQVFPRRKALIKDVSQRFVSDVDGFIKEHFSSEQIDGPLFTLRDEIKALQSTAKFLTLNTHAFNYTRENLSSCWDKIKQLEKVRKSMRSEQKTLFKKNAEEVSQKIEEMREEFTSSKLSVQQTRQKCSEISTFMRDVELGRDEVRQLKDALNNVHKLISKKEEEAEEQLKSKEREKEELRLKVFESLKEEIETLLSDAQDIELSVFVEKFDAYQEQQKSGSFTKREKQTLRTLFNQLKDMLSQKKEQAIIASSGDNGRRLLELKELLRERQERRKEVKEQIETYRLAKGASASDFEQAWSQTLLLNDEKARLEEIDQSIKEVEQKIADLETQISSF